MRKCNTLPINSRRSTTKHSHDVGSHHFSPRFSYDNILFLSLSRPRYVFFASLGKVVEKNRSRVPVNVPCPSLSCMANQLKGFRNSLQPVENISSFRLPTTSKWVSGVGGRWECRRRKGCELSDEQSRKDFTNFIVIFVPGKKGRKHSRLIFNSSSLSPTADVLPWEKAIDTGPGRKKRERNKKTKIDMVMM